MVDESRHGQGIVAGYEGEVVDGGVSNYTLFVGREAEGYVALGKMVSVWDGSMALGGGDGRLTIATVMTDGLGMNANPDRLGSPAAAVRLIFTPVTLNPCKPFIPKVVRCHKMPLATWNTYLCMCWYCCS